MPSDLVVARDSDAAKILKKIKNAWVAGIISGVITLFFILLSFTGTNPLGLSEWDLIDAAIILGLSYGIYRKSRVCAVLMLVYFISAKILLMLDAGKPTGLLMALVFIYYYVQGAIGTFQYHKLQRATKMVAPPASA